MSQIILEMDKNTSMAALELLINDIKEKYHPIVLSGKLKVE